MTFSWKIPTATAGGAFLLSLIVGLFGRVGFGTAVSRGLLWAVIFGALAFGVDYLLRRFLPEFFSGQENEVGEGERAVDITIDEENPLTGAEPVIPENAPVNESPDDFLEVPQGSDNEKAEDSEEEVIPSAEDVFSDENEEIAELEQVDEAEAPADGVGNAPEISGDDQSDTGGELPSLESVETAFEASNVEEQGDEQSAVNIDALGIEEDPAIVAKAVRTIMNKDQEG